MDQLRDTYRIDFAEKLTFDTTLMYTAIAEEQVDVIAAYTTDGRVAEFDLVIWKTRLTRFHRTMDFWRYRVTLWITVYLSKPYPRWQARSAMRSCEMPTGL